MYIYQCEDTLEGVFTAIYNIYQDRRRPEEAAVSVKEEEPVLFAEYIPVRTDREKSDKVIRTLQRLFGEKDYYSVCLALASEHEKKAQAVYRTIAGGLCEKCRQGHLFDNLADENVHLAFALGRGAGREYDHLRGFLRFEELEHGILYAKIGPKNRILPFLMAHFADRLPAENFMIYDAPRRLLGIHPARGNGNWYLVQCDERMEAEMAQTLVLGCREKEREYQEFFRYFCHKIGIEERRNFALQRNMLPLRFRGYMTEFAGENDQ